MVKTPKSKDSKQPTIKDLFKAPDTGAPKDPPPAHPSESSTKITAGTATYQSTPKPDYVLAEDEDADDAVATGKKNSDR